MIAWLKKWIARDLAHDLYHPKGRMIYQFFNGEEVIRIDPMVLYKRLADIGPELDVDIRVARSESKAAPAAYESMITKIRSVFDVKSLAEGGLTEAETVELFDHFLAYNSNLKKNSAVSATSSARSETSAPSSAAGPATWSSTDSGSIASGSGTAKPAPSPLGPELPSVS